ncbi:hypothetical protein DFP72DRAFT_1133725 [Ephemerocybe angulata]|uniref:Uncharacterized protein n=1 Tax=Ephemerocybe angulata TaxID=980116 RepID=A0A8H6HST6_9AGAR|nr:hypothetical protein DFP72DRAFT_1133725 [Tulosesus angulatus]
MRLSFITLLPIALSLASFASAYHDVRNSLWLAPLIILITSLQNPLQHTNEAREYVNDLRSRVFDDYTLERREVLEDIATRDLLDELEDRLARRGRFLCTVAGCNFVGNLPYDFPLSCQREGVRPGCTPRGQLWRIAATSSTEGIVEGRHGGITAPIIIVFRGVCHGTFRPLSIRFSHDGRVNILEGADRADTLGPKGRNVIIEQSCCAHKVTKVATSITLKARFENLGVHIVQDTRRTGSPETARHPLPSSSVSRPCHLLLGFLANGDTTVANLFSQATEKVGKKGVPHPFAFLSFPRSCSFLSARVFRFLNPHPIHRRADSSSVDSRCMLSTSFFDMELTCLVSSTFPSLVFVSWLPIYKVTDFPPSSGFMPSPVLRQRRQGANGLVREADIAPTRHLHRTGSRRPIPVLDGEGPGDAPKRSLTRIALSFRSGSGSSLLGAGVMKRGWGRVKARLGDGYEVGCWLLGKGDERGMYCKNAYCKGPDPEPDCEFRSGAREERLEEEWGVIVGRLEDDSGVEGKVNWWYYAGVGESVDMVAVGGCRSLERSCRCAWGGEFVDYNWRVLEGPGGA